MMDCSDFEMSMASALGGELSSGDRPAFEAHLATCRKCRRDYETARAAVSAMRSLSGPQQVSVRREGDRLVIEDPRFAQATWPGHGREARRAGRRGRHLLRYAASLLIAFTAGYAVHAGLMAADAARRHGSEKRLVEEDRSAERPDSLQRALLRAHIRKPSRSTLAKCLIAIAPRSR